MILGGLGGDSQTHARGKSNCSPHQREVDHGQNGYLLLASVGLSLRWRVWTVLAAFNAL